MYFITKEIICRYITETKYEKPSFDYIIQGRGSLSLSSGQEGLFQLRHAGLSFQLSNSYSRARCPQTTNSFMLLQHWNVGGAPCSMPGLRGAGLGPRGSRTLMADGGCPPVLPAGPGLPQRMVVASTNIPRQEMEAAGFLEPVRRTTVRGTTRHRLKGTERDAPTLDATNVKGFGGHVLRL